MSVINEATEDKTLGGRLIWFKDRFLDICNTYIKREGIKELLKWLELSDFFTAPASTKYHGAYDGGLIEHSLNVYDCLKNIVAKYPELNISDESVAICALFHDLCKANTYKTGIKNVKNPDTGQWEQKEIYEFDEVFPIGHGEKSCIIIQWFLKKLSVDELLAIRWHMGGFDASVKGGAYGMNNAYDKCPLASMLHLADMEATFLLERKS